MKFDFNDVLIQAAVTSPVIHRSEINPLYPNGFLPLITAPMDTVINNKNGKTFVKSKIIPCFPRGEKYTEFGCNSYFYSYGLYEFSQLVENKELLPNGQYLIDIANGHMDILAPTIKKAKEQQPFIILMVGNVANPETYRVLSEAGADYVRVGIGNGNGCLTTENTGVGYPMGSLVSECYKVSCQLDNPAKIVADGGMKTYSDVIKALALGADYVMLGSILNKSLESAGFNYLWGKIRVSQKQAEWLHKRKFTIYKKFRGMSTKPVQKKWGSKEIKTSEGVIRYRKVEYRLSQWTENFTHYLKTAMSYCGAKSLGEFIGNVDYNIITNNAYKRFNK